MLCRDGLGRAGVENKGGTAGGGSALCPPPRVSVNHDDGDSKEREQTTLMCAFSVLGTGPRSIVFYINSSHLPTTLWDQHDRDPCFSEEETEAQGD